MKRKMLKSIFIVLLCLISIVKTNEINVNAAEQEVLIDDILYTIDYKNNKATVKGLEYGSERKHIEIPEKVGNYTVTTIGLDAFEEREITSLILPSSITTIEDNAFIENKLKNVILPEGLEYIGREAFSMNKIETIKMPDSITYVGSEAFRSNGAKSVSISKNITSIEDGLFDGNYLTSVEIPDKVTYIGDYAFSENKLTSIDIPDSVKVVGRGAFLINKLTSVSFSKNLTVIDEDSFGFNNLETISIPKNITTIKEQAFVKNNLTSLGITSNLKHIESDVFTCNINLDTVFIDKVEKLDYIVDLLKKENVFISNETSSSKLRVYALDNISSNYSKNTKQQYILDKGKEQLLSVEKAYYPEIKTIDATANDYKSPEGIIKDIDLNSGQIEWYKDNKIIGNSKELKVKEQGMYYALINKSKKLDNIDIKYSQSSVVNNKDKMNDIDNKKGIKDTNLSLTGNSNLSISGSLILFSSLLTGVYYIRNKA